MSPADERPAKVALIGATAATEVSLIDSAFTVVKHGLHRAEALVPAGIYKARFRLGSEISDERFEAEPGATVTVRGRAQVAVSSAPLPGTRLTTTEGPLGDSDLQAIWQLEDDATLCVGLCKPPRGEAVEVWIQSLPDRAPLELASYALTQAQLWWAKLRPGVYILGVKAGEETLCRAVPVAAGLRTVVWLPPGDAHGSLEQSSLLMTRRPRRERVRGHAAELKRSATSVRLDPELLVQDMARQALAQSRSLLGPEELVERSGVSPLTLLLSAHGLLSARRMQMAHPFDPPELTREERAALRHAYRRLERPLGRTPDVAVLGVLTGERTEPVNLDVPPLLASTWRALVTLSESDPDAVKGGTLDIAEKLVPSMSWLLWSDRRRDLERGARAILEPALRPSPGRLPAWVDTPELDQLMKANTGQIARGLELPRHLALRLALDMERQRLEAARDRALRRAAALRHPDARVCLVARTWRGPDTPGAAFDEDVEAAAERAGLIAVQAPPVLADSAEMTEALSHADVVVTDQPEDASPMLLQRRNGPGPGWALALALERWAAKSGEDRLVRIDPAGLDDLPGRLERAAQAAPTWPPSIPRTGWLEVLARAEEQRVRLRALAAERERGAAARLEREVYFGELFLEAPSVQLELFLAFRAHGDWKRMLKMERLMPDALRRTVLVREQRALALKWSEDEVMLEEAADILREVIREIGPNGETCGLLGGVYKMRQLKASGDAAYWREQAIDSYREGAESSPEDPYSQVNLITMLALKGTPEAMEERARRLPALEKLALERVFRRPSFWDLATLVEISANKRQRHACEEYRHLALATPHEPWQRASAAMNLRLLRSAAAPGFEDVAKWLDPIIDSLK